VTSSSPLVTVPECSLSSDLGEMFQHGWCSDITLCMQGREFQAHKAILAGMSQCYFVM